MSQTKEGGNAPLFFLEKSPGTGYLVFLTSFVVYMFALCPTIYVGDSSLFSASSFMLGTAHPPGYPLTVFLGKLFTLLPFGNVAFKVNLLSAVSGALTTVFVYHASNELGSNRYASWAAALICALSPMFFSESIKAEAYTLNSLLVMVAFILGYRIIKGGDFFRLSLGAIFTVGLGMGNHHTIALAGLALLLPLGLRWRELSVRWLIFAILCFLAGFSVNLLLYIRSTALERPVESLIYSYAGSLEDFIKVLLREDFGGSGRSVKALSGETSRWFHAAKNSLYYIVYASTRPVIIFTVLGIVALIGRKLWRVLAYFTAFLAIWLIVLSRMVMATPSPGIDHIQTVSVYFLPVLPVLYCLVALGFTLVIDFLRKKHLNILGQAIPYILAILPFVFLPFTMKDYRLDRTFIAYDSARDMLQGLPVKSLIMNHTDNATFGTYYMRSVERFREDLLEMSTAGEGNVFGLQTSPHWKYEQLFPEFYQARKSTLAEINAIFARNNRLYVNNPLNRVKVFSKDYSYYPSLFSALLLPRSLEPEKQDHIEAANRNFIHALERASYERTIVTPYPYDYMARELFTGYGYGLAVYSDITRMKGDREKADRFLELSMLAAEPQLFAWPYITYLIGQDREEEAFRFVESLKASDNTSELAFLLEDLTRSAVEKKHAK